MNKRRISAHGYCGKRRADITANSVTLCEISAWGYFCGYFAWIGDITIGNSRVQSLAHVAYKSGLEDSMLLT